VIPGAPEHLDLRACIALEQVAELNSRTAWDDMEPVVVLLDSDFEVIEMHVLTDGQRSPQFWVANYQRVYGAVIDLAASLIVSFKVHRIIEDPEATGEAILTEDGVTQTCEGHRHADVRMVAWFSRDRGAESITIDKDTGEASWGVPEEHENGLFDCFERLVAGDA
jgi:hypothetical protein